ncbi:hypothetical protein B0J13DRAFT_2149 [Dactylonectria estremocensis]|uniref:RING-type domain-containing protein n=1 Tax=Dactylonectria estremocensis TaxID=1079267 RepID=A0A9P9FG46_9HYPO|nr:hypothetical protein B0J13DRAFT_2149 [Dactylonectria estremocensis]
MMERRHRMTREDESLYNTHEKTGPLYQTSGPEEHVPGQSPLEEPHTGQPPGAQSPTSEYFWPTLKSQIQHFWDQHKGAEVDGTQSSNTRLDTQHGDEHPRVQAACNVCLDVLHIPGLSDPDPAGPAGKDCWLTPCGHIFCRPCFRRVLEAQSPDMPRFCPVCRMEFSCRRCGQMPRLAHPQVKKVRDSCDDNDLLGSNGLTIPEGGKFARECLRCSSRRTWAEQVDEQQASGSSPASTLAPGFARLVSSIIDQLEDKNHHRPRVIDRRAVAAAFEDMLESGFQKIKWDRLLYINREMQRLDDERANPWFHAGSARYFGPSDIRDSFPRRSMS